MKIGLDAKRIFKNGTGLGVYGRNLIFGLQKLNTSYEFTLFTPKDSKKYFDASQLNRQFTVKESQSFSSYYWRTFSILNDIKKQHIDVYHGLSNELPYFINKLNCKSIVDIHDLCFVNFKQDYNYIDQKIFWYKAERAAKLSDKIIATSEATKKDIIQHFKVKESKIDVVYQCCDTQFYATWSEKAKTKLKQKLQLPEQFILSVGTIQGRKNQQLIVEALANMDKNKRLPLVLVGNGKDYLQGLIQLAKAKKVSIKLLQNLNFSDLPGIYQSADLFIYPSFTEGFGIPVLEAMASKVPVLTSEKTSMAEIIQDENNLISPSDADSLAEKIEAFLKNKSLALVEKHYQRSLNFSQEKFARDVLAIYESL